MECKTPIQTLWLVSTLVLSITGQVVNLVKDSEDDIILNTEVTFYADHTEASVVILDEYFGDGDIESICGAAGGSNDSTSHIFDGAGLFEVVVKMYLEDNTYLDEDRLTINVVNPTGPITVTGDYTEYLYGRETDVVFTTVFTDPPNVLVPIQSVDCVMKFPDATNQTFPQGDITDATTWTLSNTVDFNALPEHFSALSNISMTCYSIADHQASYHQIYFASPMEKVNLTMANGPPFGISDEPLVFRVTAKGGELGTSWTFSTDSGYVTSEYSTDTVDFEITTPALNRSGLVTATITGNDTGSNFHSDTLDVTLVNRVIGLQLDGPPLKVTPDVTTTYVISLVDPNMALPPEAVTCDWTMPDGATYSEVYGDFDSVNHQRSLTHDMGDAAGGDDRNTTVLCNNGASEQFLSVPFKLVRSIKYPELVPEADVHPVGESLTYDVNATFGEAEVVYELFWGDSIMAVYYKPFHEDHTIDHTFYDVGVYVAKLYVTDPAVNFDTQSVPVHIRRPMVAVGLDFNTTGVIPDGKVTFKVSSQGTLLPPSNVTCNLTLTDGTSIVVFQENFTEWSYTHQFTNSFLGYRDSSVNCTNGLVDTYNVTTVLLMEKITNLTIEAEKYFGILFENFTFRVSADMGSPHVYEVDFKDGTIETVDFYANYTLNFTISHFYTVPAEYNVSVKASSLTEDETAYVPELVLVETAIPPLLLTTDSPIPLPPGALTATIVAFDVTWIPVGVNVVLETELDGNVTELLQDVDMVNAGHVTTVPYTEVSIGDTVLSLLAYNHINSVVNHTTVRVIQLPTTPLLTADMYYAIVDQVVTFTIALVNGSHLNYTLSFPNDPNAPGDFTDLYTDVLLRNRESVHTHSFPAEGTYTATTAVSNWFHTETATIEQDVVVEYVMPEITVVSNTPLVTPPGFLDLTIDVVDPLLPKPAHIHCTYTIGDVEGTVTHPHYDPFTVPVTESFRYFPNQDTIHEVLTSTVNCSNFISSVTATTTTEIIPDYIRIGKLRDSGPSKPNEDVIFTLEVLNYAYDPCFYWEFVNSGRIVLFGNSHCLTFRPSVVHDEFVLLAAPTDEVTYTYQFVPEEVHEVKVYVENSISNDSTSWLYLIMPEYCDPPTVSLGILGRDPENIRVERMDVPFPIIGSVILVCDVDVSFIYHWEFIKKNDSGFVETVHMLQPNVTDYSYIPGTLQPGDYMVTMYVAMTQLPIFVNNSDTIYIRILPATLHVELIGGHTKMFSLADDPVTFTTEAYDTLLPEDGPEGIDFKWFCTEYTGSLPVHDFTSAAAMSCLSLTDADTNGTHLWIPASALTAGTTIYVAVYVEKLDRLSSETDQLGELVSEEVLQLEIWCERNCLELINPNSVLVLAGSCTNCDVTDIPTYSWNVSRLDGAGNVQDSMLASTETLDKFKPRATIAKGRLLAGELYEFTLEGVSTDGRRFGMAAVEMVVNQPPYGGTCSLPTSVTAMEKGQVECKDWKDDELLLDKKRRRRRRRQADTELGTLLYEIYVMSLDNESSLLSYGVDPLFPPGYLPFFKNSSININGLVFDSFLSFADAGDEAEMLAATDVANKTFGWLYEAKKLSEARAVQDLLQLCLAVMSLVDAEEIPEVVDLTPNEVFLLYNINVTSNDTGTGNDTSSGFKLAVRQFFTEAISPLAITSPSQILLEACALEAIASKPRLLNDPTVDDLLDLMVYLTEKMDAVIQYTMPEYVDLVAEKLLIVGMACIEAEGHVPADLQPIIDECMATLIDCDMNGLLMEIAPEQYDRLNNITANITAAFGDVLDLYLHDMALGVPFRTINIPDLEVVTGTARTQFTESLEIGQTFGSIKMPSSTSFPGLDENSCMDVKYLAFRKNPYVLVPFGPYITTPVQKLWFEDCDSQTEITPSPASADDPFISKNPTGVPPSNGTYLALNDSHNELGLHDFVHQDNAYYVQLFFTPGQLGMVFNVFVSYNTTPDNAHYEYTTRLGFNEHIDEETRKKTYTPANDTLTYILPRNYTNSTGLYWVAVMITALPGYEIVETNYTFDVKFVICGQVFGEEDDLNWDPFQCEVTTDTVPQVVVFKSTLFCKSFGAGLLIAPNTIDFGSVFHNIGAKLLANIHVLVTLCGLIILFLSLLPYARYRDRKDKHNWTPLPVMCCLPSHSFFYEIHVYTGLDPNSATRSRIYMKLTGALGDTGKLEMKDDESRKNFEFGSLTKFIVSSPSDIGTLRSITVKNDNSGEGKWASWYLQKIMVYDKQTNKQYLFLCEEWLALEKGDGRLEKVLPLATREEVYQSWSMMRRRYTKAISEEHTFVSVFMRQSEDHFTRAQRLGCAFSLLFMNMIANAMWFQTDQNTDTVNGIQIGPISFTLATLITSVYAILTVYPVIFILISLFQKAGPKKIKEKNQDVDSDSTPSYDDRAGSESKLQPGSQAMAADPEHYGGPDKADSDEDQLVKEQEEEEEEKAKKKKKNPRPLPHFVIYIAWFLVAAIMLLSSFFSLLYSFEWGGERSAQWLGAFFLSFFEGEGLIDPVKALMLALILSLLFRKPVDDVSGLSLDSEHVYRDEEGGVPDEEMEKLRKRRVADIRIKKVSRQLVYHIVFLIALLLICNGSRDTRSYFANEEIRQAFIGNTLYPTISTPAQAFLWVREIAIPMIFPEYGYNGVRLKGYDRTYTENGVDLRLGPLVLRQYRIKPDLCDPPKQQDVLSNFSCNVDIDGDNEDRRLHYPGWTLEHNMSLPTPPNSQWYSYRTESDMQATFYGWFRTYSGGGYVVPLGESYSQASRNMDMVDQLQWLDRFTRAMIMELNIYNANANLFTMVTVIFEFPSFGGCLADINLFTMRIYEYFGAYGVLALASQITVIIFVLVFTVRMFVLMIRDKKEYFSRFWNYLEILKLTFALVAIGAFIYRVMVIQTTVEKMKNNPGESVSFAAVNEINELFVTMMAIALFIQILQLLWVLGFTKAIAVFTGTLWHTIGPLASFAFCFGVTFVAFLFWSNLAYQGWLYEYRDLLHSTYQQLSAMLNNFDAVAIMQAAGFIGQLIFFSYETVMNFIILNLLITVLMDIHAEVAEGNLEISKDYEIMDALMEKIMEGFKKTKKRELLSEDEMKKNGDTEPFDTKGLSLMEIFIKMKKELNDSVTKEEDEKKQVKDKDPGAPIQDATKDGAGPRERDDQKAAKKEEKQEQEFDGTIPGEAEKSGDEAENTKATEAAEALEEAMK